MSESLYSTSEVAKLFEINRVTIYRWVQEGVVKAYKVGKHLKIPASEVERLWKEFGFPGASYLHVSDISRKNKTRDPVYGEGKYNDQKKMIIAVGNDEDDLGFIQNIFLDEKIRDECRVILFVDTLEAALAIGKEKPDLLLIKMKPDGSSVEFAKKIKGIHSDIKIIFVGSSSMNQNKEREGGLRGSASETIGQDRLQQEIANALGLHGRR